MQIYFITLLCFVRRIKIIKVLISNITPELLDLEDIWCTAPQQVTSLLGKIWRAKQVLVPGAQGIAGVIVTVCGQKHLRGSILIRAMLGVCQSGIRQRSQVWWMSERFPV